MTTDLATFGFPAAATAPKEYEDAFAADAEAGRFALADGATESSFAALWAQLLVNDFVQNAACDIDNWKASLSALQEQWYASVRRPSHSRGTSRPSWSRERLRRSWASRWCAARWHSSLGGDGGGRHLPLSHPRLDAPPRVSPWSSRTSSMTPPLLGSRMSPEAIQKTPALHLHGDGLADDRLWMMTDALVQWCLMEHEGGRDPWGEIDSILAQPEPQRRFAAWIDELRFSRQLHNDDVTLLLIIL